MKHSINLITLIVLAVLVCIFSADFALAKEIVRPEEIKSKRQVIYDDETYKKLAQLWKEYYDEYPSEYAYANWMYATRYAGGKEYSELLTKGVKEYPTNPTLLYLKSLEHHGARDNTEGRAYLEQAIELDPNFVDPWFSLVINYMDSNEDEKLNIALRHLLESGTITEEVMDYNYNMLISMEENAILITNGDNDTYPGWILTRILKERPDVIIVNRSLLNTEWYPLYVIEQGLPSFIGKDELKNLRISISKMHKDKFSKMTASGPFGDTLIEMIVESAERAGRPVYFSKTLYATDKISSLIENGRDLGLVSLVTSSKTPYNKQLRDVYEMWLKAYRTGGINSWRIKYAKNNDAVMWIIPNYVAGIVQNLSTLKDHTPELRIKLFNWYNDHLENLLPEDHRYKAANVWCCYAADIKEVDDWCKKQGMECKESTEK